MTGQFWLPVLHWITGENAIRGQRWVSSPYLSLHTNTHIPEVLEAEKRISVVRSKTHFNFLIYNKNFPVYIFAFWGGKKKKIPFKLSNKAVSEEVKTVQIYSLQLQSCSFL